MLVACSHSIVGIFGKPHGPGTNDFKFALELANFLVFCVIIFKDCTSMLFKDCLLNSIAIITLYSPTGFFSLYSFILVNATRFYSAEENDL